MSTKHFHAIALAGVSTLAISMAAAASAQTAPADDDVDEIVVQGIRGSIEESLEVKRNNTVISDALIGVELGDLPDLSIAESLERITGVTSDRFKGGASSISVRGLGDFLGFATLNGREVSSGSDGRGVNYGQFPSELFGGVVVYKSQQASLVEGGVSGVISLNTLRPLDYNKRRITLLGLGGYSEYEDRVDGGEPISQRYTASYIDQFETGIGDVGIAIGGQIRRDTAPEEVFVTSSTFRPCTQDFSQDGGSNCEGVDSSNPVYFISNQYIYRAMSTQADRDAIMANVQWQPNSQLDLNFDFQYSDRYDLEDRGNLVVADGRRRIDPIAISEDSGALLAWEGNSRLENQSVYRVREESYIGGGMSAEWQGDALTLTADIGYNKTERTQDELDMRIRTNDRLDFRLDTRDVEIPTLTLLDVSDIEEDTGVAFDLDSFEIWDNGARARRRQENIDDEVFAVSLTSDYVVETDFLTNIKTGLRYSSRQRFHDDSLDTTFQGDDLANGYDSDAVAAVRRDVFIVDDLYAGADTEMEGITWATWDSESLFTALTGSEGAGIIEPGDARLSPDDTDVTEDTYAFFVQGDFVTQIGGLPAAGNIGLRAVRTEIESVGVSRAFVTEAGPEVGQIILTPVGETTLNVERNNFTNFLPSANLTLELNEDQLLRFAGYRAIARPSMEDMSAGLAVPDSPETVADLAGDVEAGGNPDLKPLSSWNADVSWEWYQSDDTAFSLAAYYKYLESGLEQFDTETSVVVDGEPVPVTVGRFRNSDEGSDLFGVEASIQHVFSNLPGFMSGFGVRGGINWADTDFEYPDPISDLTDLTKPLSLPGYSRFSGNATVFWENDDWTVRVAYKGRSGYNKPFRLTSNRFTGAQDFLDFSVNYDITDNIELRFQGLNLLDEPNIFYRPVKDSYQQADFGGRRYFFGARARF